nr:MAG TPA: hypothetical protein [Caudoviricetes sp.]
MNNLSSSMLISLTMDSNLYFSYSVMPLLSIIAAAN